MQEMNSNDQNFCAPFMLAGFHRCQLLPPVTPQTESTGRAKFSTNQSDEQDRLPAGRVGKLRDSTNCF
jgi:hypothetical protein